MGEELSWAASYNQPTYELKEGKEAFLVSLPSREPERNLESDSKRWAIDEKIEMLAGELCMIKKTEGVKEFNDVSSTMESDDFIRKAFLRHIKKLGNCKEICHSIIRRGVTRYML